METNISISYLSGLVLFQSIFQGCFSTVNAQIKICIYTDLEGISEVSINKIKNLI